MSEINQIRKCYSCGATLQCTDPSKEGYVKKETLENASQNFLFCDNCFEKERFHSSVNEPVVTDDFLKLLSDAKKNDALLVYVVNLFSFEAGFSSKINNLIQGMNILVVANKFDLLPKGTTEASTIEYMRHRFKVSGLPIEKDRIMISNAFDDETARNIISRIYELRKGKNVYIIGSELAGKRTLVSSFLRVYRNLSNGSIETHDYKKTSVRVMEIPLNKTSSMYVTPGITNTNSVLSLLDNQTLKRVYLTEPVEKKTISLSEGQDLLIGGLAIVEMVSGDKTKLDCYFSNNIQYKKVSSKKGEQTFLKLVTKKAIKPCSQIVNSAKDMDLFEIKVTEANYRDLGIQGLGWITFKANNQVLRIYVPKHVSIYTSRTKVMGK